MDPHDHLPNLFPYDLRKGLCPFVVVGRNHHVEHRASTSLYHLDHLFLPYLPYPDPTLYHLGYHPGHSDPHVHELDNHGWRNMSLHQVRAV